MKKNAFQIIVMVLFFPVTVTADIFKWVFEENSICYKENK
jgi:hypothetical protein